MVSHDLDYKSLGLKVGLEIHQQLDTSKLFCNCPSVMRDDAPDKTVKRILRASAGETGTVDVAAKAEMEKEKYFIYEFYTDTNCLVELDEEPPHSMNKEALDIVLTLSKMMHAQLVDQIHVMRKTVVDGSNTSGFQRTALVARNGFIEVPGEDDLAKVRIETLCIEEDAAKIIGKEKDHSVYRLDRLGIPLIEIATGPDLRTPQQAKDAAAYIGMLLRSTGRVKRGLGTIRQDVNVSILGGARAEIKGVQDLRLLDEVVRLEALRQFNMIGLRKILIEKKVSIKDIDAPIADYTKDFDDTQNSGFIKKGLISGLRIYGKPYRNFKGVFGHEINPNRRFGTELSDRIKILGLSGLIHTDENLEKYQIFPEVESISRRLNLLEDDGMIFILGTPEKCMLAFRKIDDAIAYFLEHGLAKEVRNAKDDGTSSFLRPMPTGSRMYPETDVRTIIPSLDDVEIPELITEKITRFEKQYSIPKQVAKEVVNIPEYEDYVRDYPNVEPIKIAITLTEYPKEIKKQHNIELNMTPEIVRPIFSSNLASSSKEILTEIAKGSSIDDALSKYKQADESEVASYIEQLIKDKPGLNASALMGDVMKKYRGKFPGQRIMELIKEKKGE